MEKVFEQLNSSSSYDVDFEDFEFFFMMKKKIVEQLQDMNSTLKKIMAHKCFMFAQ